MGDENSPPKDSKPTPYRLTREKRTEFEALVNHYGATEEQMAAWKKFFSRCQNKPPKPSNDAFIKQAIEWWHESKDLFDEKQWDNFEKSYIVTAKRKVAEGLWNEKRYDEELLALRKMRENDRLGLLQIPDPMLQSDVETVQEIMNENKRSHSRGISEDARFLLRALRHGGLSIVEDMSDDWVARD